MANATMIEIETALRRSTTTPFGVAGKRGSPSAHAALVRRPTHCRGASEALVGRFPPLPASVRYPTSGAPALFPIHAVGRQCAASSALGVADRG